MPNPDAQFNDVSIDNQFDVNNKLSIASDYVDFANGPVFFNDGIMLPQRHEADVPANPRGRVLFSNLDVGGKLYVRTPQGSLIPVE